MQFDRMVGDLRVVNAGSVGMPFGEPAAYWLMLEADVKLRRTNYDLHHAASTFRKTDYPEVEKFIANELLNPKTEAEMLGLFSKAELK